MRMHNPKILSITSGNRNADLFYFRINNYFCEEKKREKCRLSQSFGREFKKIKNLHLKNAIFTYIENAKQKATIHD